VTPYIYLIIQDLWELPTVADYDQMEKLVKVHPYSSYRTAGGKKSLKFSEESQKILIFASPVKVRLSL
jgi:hypothetical protein